MSHIVQKSVCTSEWYNLDIFGYNLDTILDRVCENIRAGSKNKLFLEFVWDLQSKYMFHTAALLEPGMKNKHLEMGITCDL